MTAIPTQRPSSLKPVVPPLQSGDRLSRDEFERRYHSMPSHVKAELIEGVVYIATPVTDEFHGGPHFDMNGWLWAYRMATPGVVGGNNSTLRLDLDNEPQPDLYLRLKPECGGQAKVDADGYVEGAPELVFEIAASSVSYDLNAKLNAYRRNQVREYGVWRTYDSAIDWFALRNQRFEPLPAGDDGVIRSEIFPGLWLDVRAMLAGDMETVARILQQGLTSPERAAFVDRLRRAMQKRP